MQLRISIFRFVCRSLRWSLRRYCESNLSLSMRTEWGLKEMTVELRSLSLSTVIIFINGRYLYQRSLIVICHNNRYLWQQSTTHSSSRSAILYNKMDDNNRILRYRESYLRYCGKNLRYRRSYLTYRGPYLRYRGTYLIWFIHWLFIDCSLIIHWPIH